MDTATLERPSAQSAPAPAGTETPNWIVVKDTFDASRPYAVVSTFRSFNKVNRRYETNAQAMRRARDLNTRRAVETNSRAVAE